LAEVVKAKNAGASTAEKSKIFVVEGNVTEFQVLSQQSLLV